IVFLAITLGRREILVLLGPQYSSLDSAVMLVAGTSLIHVATNYTVIVNRVRGWNKLEPLATIAQFTAQALLIAWLPLNSTERILALGLVYAIASVLITFSINIIGFAVPGWAQSSSSVPLK